MSEDLLSLRMLMVATPQSDCALWSLGAMRASIPIEFSIHDPARGMPQGAVDILVVDGGLSEVAATQMVQAARALHPAPLVVVCGAEGAAGPPGADGLLPQPTSPEEARHVVDLCVRACLPKRVLI